MAMCGPWSGAQDGPSYLSTTHPSAVFVVPNPNFLRARCSVIRLIPASEASANSWAAEAAPGCSERQRASHSTASAKADDWVPASSSVALRGSGPLSHSSLATPREGTSTRE